MTESDPALHDRTPENSPELAANRVPSGVETRLRQQFFRLMSQEYRTSLSTILMSVDELELDAAELDREDAVTCRQQIRLAIEHMRRLLDEAQENF
ncbi:MAG: hypothetical protein ACFB9N_11145 [Geitlerinemataceae cyanobacterium]